MKEKRLRYVDLLFTVPNTTGYYHSCPRGPPSPRDVFHRSTPQVSAREPGNRKEITRPQTSTNLDLPLWVEV